MSNSYIVESQDIGSEKKDDTLIIVVNDDGTISVDQQTLQNLIMNQSNANVSVVRLGQTEEDIANGDITLTVDPPPFAHPTVSSVSGNSSTDLGGLVDPFMEMDPEQLERLETALQSEEAKQILGENVTAMLDMLSVEEQQNTIRYCIQLDHCYTTRLSPTDPIPRDPLPVVDSPESNDVQYVHQPSSPRTSIASSVNDIDSTKGKSILKSGREKQVNRPVRKVTVSAPSNLTVLPRASTNIGATPKLLGHAVSRNITNVQQATSKAQRRNNEEEDELTESSTESSESEPPSDNDNDSDFGPRSTKRGNIRARGGRKGLTTRGGSMIAIRRRGQNKQLDMEQVRRLDMEMAAAVNAMKSPEKDDRSERFSPTKSKRQIKILGGKKKEESQFMETSPSEEPSIAHEKPLQTTNQVKANLISANMIKGDMILTKPGQNRSNQKVTFVQKQVLMKPNELKSIGIKKSLVVPKEKLMDQTGAKLFTTKDGKLVQLPMASKIVSPSPQVTQVKAMLTQQSVSQQSAQSANPGLPVQQQLKTAALAGGTLSKIKLGDIKKDKKKSDTNVESLLKGEETPIKFAESKALDSMKKHLKKESRKPPAYVADTLGPALFSTPDIIRRVSSSNEGKLADNVTTPTIPTASCTSVSMSESSTVPISATISLGISASVSSVAQSTATGFGNKKTVSSEQSVQPETQLSLDEGSKIEPENQNESKSKIKIPLIEEMQPSLDSVPNTVSSEGIIQPMVPHVPNHVVSKTSGIEGEEHLLATLEMEASKHEEELLAEALLLQEELGVDLADHPSLVDSAPTVSEPLTSSSMLMPTMPSEQELSKPMETMQIAQAQLLHSPKDASKKSLKDDKEPIQIVRGGRVITLPPIEAPATRSKRLQAKVETSQKNLESVKKINKFSPQVQQLHKEELKTVVSAEDEEDDEDDEEDNSDSEDDPDRLWCICKRPHNNRFMICCDVCEDWFHGKCVHVSKAMGQQMEEKGIEWVCPNCLRKKAEEERTKLNSQPLSGKQKIKAEPAIESAVSQTVSSLKEVCPSVSSTDGTVLISGTMQCVVCKKEARNSSIYCSDACILAHAQETLTKDKPVPGPSTKLMKTPVTEIGKVKAEARVIVFDRKTGKILTGADAPTRSNLRTWLKENPTFEVVGANSLSTLQIDGKLVTQMQTSGKAAKITQLSPVKMQTIPKMIYTKVVGSKQTILAPSKKVTIIPATQHQINLSSSSSSKPVLKQTIITTSGKSPMILKTISPKNITPLKLQTTGSPKQTPIKKQDAIKLSPSQSKQQAKPMLVKKPETEPVRVSIRKSLTEQLSSRIKETEDLKLTDGEIAELAFNIELEMYKYFKDTGAKYKAKYRSLIFNIKDTKNLTLFRKIADHSLTPYAVVRLSSDEMASQELAEWREKETKHQLEMIKKNELDMMAQAKSIVVKTHKGEQIIENDGSIDHVDPKTPVQDIVIALNSGDNISSTVEDMDKDKEKEDRSKSRMDTNKSKISVDERKRKDKERGRERDSSRVRSKGKERRERSRSRHRRSHDRDRSKTRDRSKEHKSSKKESRREKDREREKDKDRERNKDRDRSRKESKERGRQKERDRHKSGAESRLRNRSGSRDSKDIDKREEERKKEIEKKKETSPPPVEKPIEDRLWRHVEDEATTNTIDGNDSDISDREPSSTVTIKTPDINEESEKDKEQEAETRVEASKGSWQTVWRGFVNMVDVAKFFITAQEVSGNARDLMDDLPDTVDVVGRISHDTVWDYISKMKRTGSKEILVIRLTAANDEEKIPYITLYSYLNSRSRLGVVGNVSKNIKDFYIMPFSSQSLIPPVLLPLTGPGFEEHRPHLLLGIIVRNRKKRLSIPSIVPAKSSKETDRSYTPPLASVPKEKIPSPPPSSSTSTSTSTSSPMLYHKTSISDVVKEKVTTVTQMTLESLNKAHIGMSSSSRGIIDTATICKIVPELSSKIDLTSSPKIALDDGDEPYSPGEMDDDDDASADDPNILSSAKNSNSTELQRKMDELNRQIEEQKQQIQNISSSFLGEATATLPGLGLDPPSNDGEEAYSPSDARSFTPPPPSAGIAKFAQPILDKVSDITIPPNLQEILANVKRQESSKVDPYLPSKPSASFLPGTAGIGASLYQSTDKYSPSSTSRLCQSEKALPEVLPPATRADNGTPRESKSTLSSLSDLDLIRKAEEELAAVAAATTAVPSPVPPPQTLIAASSSTSNLVLPSPPPPSLVAPINSDGSSISSQQQQQQQQQQVLSSLSLSATDSEASKVYKPNHTEPLKKSFVSEQPKPPGLEDEDFPATFPSTPPMMDASKVTHSKISPKSGIVLSIKRKVNDDGASLNSSSVKLPRTRSRWGQGPAE